MSKSAKNGVSERNLQYGPLKKPIEPEVKHVEKKAPINEELFYATKGQVLELKPEIFDEQDASSEEETSESDEPKKQKGFQPAALNYESIGYKKYQPENPRYVVVKNPKPVKHTCTKRQRKHHRHQQPRRGESCGCYKDSAIDQSAVSEQSTSFEQSPNEQGPYNVRFST
jgi:hypothetical protein